MLAAGRRPLPVERDATRVFECENEYASLWASEYVTGCQWLSMCVGVRPPETVGSRCPTCMSSFCGGRIQTTRLKMYDQS